MQNVHTFIILIKMRKWETSDQGECQDHFMISGLKSKPFSLYRVEINCVLTCGIDQH